MVFSGFVMAWRFATWPTSRSPVLVNATTEGVVRPPSALGITCGSPPSITATHEFVVPRSMPMIFPILPSSCVCGGAGRPPRWVNSLSAARGTRRPSRLRLLGCARGLDRDLPGLGLFGLRNHDFKDPVAVRRLYLVGLHRMVQRERALERSVHPLQLVIGRVLLLLG